ncbi:MAG: ABC transporter ATP-binding protein [Pseudomonadota bacterium]
MIELKNLCKTYVTAEMETTALKDVTLSVAAGDFVAVKGPSGCGKSSLMNILGLIDTPTSGSYEIDGADIAGLKENDLVKLRRDNIGFVFQSFNLIDDLNIYENVALPLRYKGAPAKQSGRRVREALELVGLQPRAKHKPGQLSGGQQQRAAVARAIIADPKLILADEPTGNLDTRNGEDVMELIELLNEQGTTIIMVTHSDAHAARAKRTVAMLDGRIVSDDAAATAGT